MPWRAKRKQKLRQAQAVASQKCPTQLGATTEKPGQGGGSTGNAPVIKAMCGRSWEQRRIVNSPGSIMLEKYVEGLSIYLLCFFDPNGF